MDNSNKINAKFGKLVSVTTTTEYLGVWSINVKRCSNILQKQDDDLSDDDIIDALISLHLILESGINALFRDLVTYRMHHGLDNLKIVESLDEVSFIDKIKMFICTFDFDFKSEDLEERKKYKDIIDCLIDFSRTRNYLLHGHTIRIVQKDKEKGKESRTRRIVSKEHLKKQINTFIHIIDGMKFYIDRLDLQRNGAKSLPGEGFLSYVFIPPKYLNQ